MTPPPDAVEPPRDLVAARKSVAEMGTEIGRLLVEGAFKDAVREAKGRAVALHPHVVPHLRAQVVDGERRVVVVTDAGLPRFSASTGAPLTVQGLLEELRDSPEFAGAFGEREPVRQDEHPAGKPVTISRADAKDTRKYHEARALAKKLGVPLEYESEKVVAPAGAVTLSWADAKDHATYERAKALAKSKGVELFVIPDECAP